MGDFNDDGRTDIALIDRSGSWSTIPIAFAEGDGRWRLANRNVGRFAGWARTRGVEPLVGDFDDDGRTDIALIGRSGSWVTLPIAFAQGDGGWVVTNRNAGRFAGWAKASGVKPLVGDFDADGRADIALIRRSGTWGTMPVAFATDLPPARGTHALRIRRHEDTALSDARADTILADGSRVLRANDGEGDVACPVALARSGNVNEFDDGDGDIDTAAELREVFAVEGNIKVVDNVNFCGGQFNTSFIGCGQVSGSAFVTERFDAAMEGILWAHEFGHNRGLRHTTPSTSLMFASIGADRLRIDQDECDAFLPTDALLASAASDSSAFAAADGATPVRAERRFGERVGSGPTPAAATPDETVREAVTVEEFVSQIYFEGLPLDRASVFRRGRGGDACPDARRSGTNRLPREHRPDARHDRQRGGRRPTHLVHHPNA